jgi:hypothetical protein
MNYLVGIKPLKHNINTNSYSVLAEIDWVTKEILRTIKIPSANYTSKDGYMRSNIQGCTIDNGKIYITQWNFIVIIDYKTFQVIDSFSHAYMSDCHGIEIVENEIFVCSTGIDAVLCFDKETHELKRFWRPEQSSLESKIPLPSFLSFIRIKSSKFYKRMKNLQLHIFLTQKFRVFFKNNKEYRGLDKTRSGLHSHHVNEISYVDNNLYVLTKGWNNTTSSSLIKLNLEFTKECFILNPGDLGGAHDIIFSNNQISFTESLSESLGLYLLDTNKIIHHKLSNNNYFVRGLSFYKDDYLIGFTPARNEKNNRFPFIAQYDKSLKKIEQLHFDYYGSEIGGAIHFIYKVETIARQEEGHKCIQK